MKKLLPLLLFAALMTDTAFAADGLFNRKKELFNAMDGAVNEMESLLSSIK